MRPYPRESLELVRSITRPYLLAHGEPIAWGEEGARSLGIEDLDGTRPDYGEPSEIREGEIAVYWVSMMFSSCSRMLETDSPCDRSGLRSDSSTCCTRFESP